MARLRLFAAVVLTAASCLAQFPSEEARLMASARLWATVEYFHPYVADGDADWDSALIKALPKIRAASNTAEYRIAISAMLDELHDAETYVLSEGMIPLVDPKPVARQMTRIHSAQKSSLLVARQTGPTEKVFLDLSGIMVSVRLSEPLAALSAPRPAKPETSNYSDSYPSAELRLLAAFKIWGATHYFFAYKDLMDEDWDEVFETYLLKVIEARDATDYNLVVADMLTHLTDTNTASHGKTIDAYFGEVPVGIRIRLLDKFPIVTDVLDPIATAAGVRPGDVVKRIGNESTTDRFRRFVQYIPASTPQRSGYDTIQKITNGPAGSELELSIENARGESHLVKLVRKNFSSVPQRSTEAVRVLPGNIGYLDLDRLTTATAEEALARLKDTNAIILDLRGQAPAAAIIASHLTSQTNVAAAFVTTPLALHPDVATPGIATQTASTFVVQTLPSPQAPLYKEKTMALIDERTIGESEYAGLLFEAANKTEFVGEPTAGADSSIAELSIPGGITITYSSQDIRHGNGGKLQRLGIEPNVPAPTTVKGLRAGKDEALDAALQHLSHQK